jgi:hypothetical protein
MKLGVLLMVILKTKRMILSLILLVGMLLSVVLSMGLLQPQVIKLKVTINMDP